MIVRVQRSHGPGSGDPRLGALMIRCVAAVLGVLVVTGIAVVSVWASTSSGSNGVPDARTASTRPGSPVVVGQFVVPSPVGGVPLIATVGPLSVTASITPRGWVVTIVGPVYSVAVSAADVPGGAATLRAVVAHLADIPGGPEAIRLAPVRLGHVGSVPAAPVVVTPHPTGPPAPSGPTQSDEPVPAPTPPPTPTIPEPTVDPQPTIDPPVTAQPTSQTPEPTSTVPSVTTQTTPDPTTPGGPTPEPPAGPIRTPSDTSDREGASTGE